MRILVFAAHPDDEVIGAGGTLIKRKKEGFQTAVCYATKAVEERNTSSEIEKKSNEILKVKEVLGLDQQYFLNFPSCALSETPQGAIIREINKIILDFKPTAIYTHFDKDLHSDHRILSENVLISTRPNNYKFLKSIYFYNEVTSSTFWSLGEHKFNPNVFVDVSNEIEKNIQAFECYKSQIGDGAAIRTPEFLKTAASFYGQMIGAKFAETFMLVRHIENN